MNKQYGLPNLVIEPTKRQQIFDSVKDKAVKCTNRTQLCAAIYPWILQLVSEYADDAATRLAIDSFNAEVYYDFHRALSVHLSAIPFVVGTDSCPLDLERIRDEALSAAIEMAVNIASLEVAQCSIDLSAIMASFVKDL